MTRNIFAQRTEKSMKDQKKSFITESGFFLLWNNTESLQDSNNNICTHEKKKMSMETSETSTMHAEQEENTENLLGKQKTNCNLHSKRNRCNNNVIVASIIAIVMTMHHTVNASPSKDAQPSVRINKCCEKFEIYVDQRCTLASDANACKYLLKRRLVL